jgi:hypothetical protein
MLQTYASVTLYMYSFLYPASVANNSMHTTPSQGYIIYS